MVTVAVFLDKEEDDIVLEFKKRWKEAGMSGTNKNEIIKRVIREYWAHVNQAR